MFSLYHLIIKSYGLSWNINTKGLLLSASEDKTICEWDICQAGKDQNKLSPLNIFKGHTSIVEVNINKIHVFSNIIIIIIILFIINS